MSLRAQRRLVPQLSRYALLLHACSFDTTPSFTAHEPITTWSGGGGTDPPAPPLQTAYDAAPALPAGRGADSLPSAGPALDAALTERDASLVDAIDAARPIDNLNEADATPSSAPALDAAVPIADAGASSADARVPSADTGVSSADAGAPSLDAARERPCMAGRYSAMLSCGLDNVPLLQVTAQAELPLRRTGQSADLTLVDGSLMFDLAGNLFAVSLAGGLTCADGKFQADLVTDATDPMGLPAPPPPQAPLSLAGALVGELDANGRNISGTWWFATPDGATCRGMWSASLQP